MTVNAMQVTLSNEELARFSIPQKNRSADGPRVAPAPRRDASSGSFGRLLDQPFRPPLPFFEQHGFPIARRLCQVDSPAEIPPHLARRVGV